MLVLLFKYICFGNKIEMEEEGYVIERSFMKSELNLMTGQVDFQEITLELFSCKNDFKLTSIGNVKCLSKENFEEKIFVRFLFQPNKPSYDFIKAEGTMFIAKYKLTFEDVEMKQAEIQEILSLQTNDDVLTFKGTFDDNFTATNTFKDNNVLLCTNDNNTTLTGIHEDNITLANEGTKSIGHIFDFIRLPINENNNLEDYIRKHFEVFRNQLDLIEDFSVLSDHLHLLVGVKRFLENNSNYGIFHKILKNSISLVDSEIEFLKNILKSDIDSLCNEMTKRNEEISTCILKAQSRNVNMLNSISYLLRILNMKAVLSHDPLFIILPTYLGKPKVNMTMLVKWRYSLKYVQKIDETSSIENEFYELKNHHNAEFYIGNDRIEHHVTKPLVTYVFVDRIDKLNIY